MSRLSHLHDLSLKQDAPLTGMLPAGSRERVMEMPTSKQQRQRPWQWRHPETRMHILAGGVDLSRSVVLPEEMYSEAPDEVEVQARLLLLFHLPRGEFRGFVEVRLVDAQVVKP